MRNVGINRTYALAANTSLIVLLLLFVGCTRTEQVEPNIQLSPPSAGTPIEPPRKVADFTLTSHKGIPLRLQSLQGKLIILYFGYTFCPDICPTTLATLVRVKHDLGDKANNVAFVFISVDGERDTPEVLAKYLVNFDKDFIGLTGSEKELRKIGVDYGLFFEKQKVEGTSAAYLVDHTAATFLIDPQGQLAMVYGYGTPPEVISRDLLKWIERGL